LRNYLEKHGIDHVIIFHVKLVRCMVFPQPLAIKQETYLIHLKALTLAICFHEPLQRRLPLDLEMNDIAILFPKVMSDCTQLSCKRSQHCGAEKETACRHLFLRDMKGGSQQHVDLQACENMPASRTVFKARRGDSRAFDMLRVRVSQSPAL
jgi:hypothetical protein